MIEQQNQLHSQAHESDNSVSFHEGLRDSNLNQQQISFKQEQSKQLQPDILMNLTLDSNSIKQLVIKNQNNDKGYYCYENWTELHNIIFGRSEEVFVHMWRTLKLINFGDDYIPTGLVFDTLVTLFNIERDTTENEPILKKLFFRFIELNGKVIFDHQKNEINYLKILKRLVEEYRIIIQKRLSEQQYQGDNQEKPRYQRLHHLHDLYVYRKNLEKLKKIDQQMKQCTFEPELSGSRNTIQSRYWREPIKRIAQITSEQQLFESSIFRAKPIPCYPNRYPSGYSTHTARIKQTYQQRSLKKSMKPLVKTGAVSEFNINNRNSQRKLNSYSNKNILFIIQIQVGKKKFMLKVRQGMSTQEVRNIIQRMVGFSDNQIYDIVEGYFNNYFKRLNKNIQI